MWGVWGVGLGMVAIAYHGVGGGKEGRFQKNFHI